MSMIFMSLKNSKNCDPFKLVLNVADKWIYKEIINVLDYQVLVPTTHGRILKSQINPVNLNYLEQYRMMII